MIYVPPKRILYGSSLGGGFYSRLRVLSVHRKRLCLIATFVIMLVGCQPMGIGSPSPPNILWLTLEDISPYAFGCYGNKLVKTPNIDRLARNGIRYTNASSTSPYCSPARSTIISGNFSSTFGNDWHREGRLVPADIYFFTKKLRDAGYFCTNNAKTDYNIDKEQWTRIKDQVWDEVGVKASYNSTDRRPGQPFFAVFNNLITHMSRLNSFHEDSLRTYTIDRDKVELPGHIPNLDATRGDLAWHLQKAQQADDWVGKVLEDLQEKGLHENTIIFFYADHGGCLPRGKAYAYESGLRVPLLVYIPQRYEHLLPKEIQAGSVSSQLVDFTDLAPTVLQLAGIEAPSHMPGEPFLGIESPKKKEIQFGVRCNTAHHYDPIRTAYDGRFKYIKHFTPYKREGNRQHFQWKMPANLAYDEANVRNDLNEPIYERHFRSRPAEMLFDLVNDPYETKNLAGDTLYYAVFEKLRKAVYDQSIQAKDLGFLPKYARRKSDSISLYEWVRSTNYPLEKLIKLAHRAADPKEEDVKEFAQYIHHKHPEFRFWAASGMAALAQRQQVKLIPSRFNPLLNDSDPYARATMAQAFAYAGQMKRSAPVLNEMVGTDKMEAYSTLEDLGEKARPFISLLKRKAQESKRNEVRFYARSILVNLGELPFGELYEQEEMKEVLAGFVALQDPFRNMP